MVILLSHHLSETTPTFAGGPPLKIQGLKEIENGDSSNSYILTMQNHLGTHIDAPRHFDPNGKPITSFPIDSFIFTRPKLIDIPKGALGSIDVSDLEPLRDKISDTDLLMIRTGFQEYRSDTQKYSFSNPSISIEAAKYLTTFPNLRAIGFDTISAACPERREEGRTTHRVLLTDRDFFIVEDMDLKQYPSDCKRILIIPIFIEGVDSSPCTILAEV